MPISTYSVRDDQTQVKQTNKTPTKVATCVAMQYNKLCLHTHRMEDSLCSWCGRGDWHKGTISMKSASS